MVSDEGVHDAGRVDDGAAHRQIAFAVGADKIGTGGSWRDEELSELVGYGEGVGRTEGGDDDALDGRTRLHRVLDRRSGRW